MSQKFLDEDNQKIVATDQPGHTPDEDDQIVEMFAEQLARLLWEHLLYNERVKDKKQS